MDTPLPASLQRAVSELAEARTPATWKIMVGVLLPLLLTGVTLQLYDTARRQNINKAPHPHSDSVQPPRLQEIYFDAFVDNFDLESMLTFPLRILVDDFDSTQKEGPLIVYTGNEGNIQGFAHQTGQVYLLAQRLNGRAAFVEQRYYGKSFPSHDNSYPFLSTEQVLADLVGAITFLKHRYGSPSVVAVGGSYGGMLTAWLQQQHPGLINAAWASSAPLLGFASTLVSLQRESGIYKLIEGNYASSCALIIGKAFRHMLTSQSDLEINETVKLCPEEDTNDLPASSLKERSIGWLQNQLGLLANFDYPYEVSFAGRVVPANPMERLCKELHHAVQTNTTQQGVGRIFAALKWFVDPISKNFDHNSSNAIEGACRVLEPSFYSYYPGLIPGPWTYQHCYDLIMAYAVPEASKMFLPCSVFAPNCWSEDRFATYCEKTFGPKPRRSQIRADMFGSDERSFLSQSIVLTNGKLDPWSYAGIGYKERNNPNAANALPPNVIWMDGASHHLDLWWPHPEDPPTVVDAREKVFQMISGWLQTS